MYFFFIPFVPLGQPGAGFSNQNRSPFIPTGSSPSNSMELNFCVWDDVTVQSFSCWVQYDDNTTTTTTKKRILILCFDQKTSPWIRAQLLHKDWDEYT